MKENVKKIVDDFLDSRCTRISDGRWSTELYLDYRDIDIEADTIREFAKAEDPRQAFNEGVYEGFEESLWAEQNSIVSSCFEKLNEQMVVYDAEEVEDYVRENVDVSLPIRDFLDNTVCVNIIVDTGDADYEYTKNNFAHGYYGGEDEISEFSSLLWLAEQQGSSRDDLERCLSTGSAFEGQNLELITARNNALRVLEDYGRRFEFGRDYSAGKYALGMSIRNDQRRVESDMKRARIAYEQNPTSYDEYLVVATARNLVPVSEEKFTELLENVTDNYEKRMERLDDKLFLLNEKIKENKLEGVMAAIESYEYLSRRFTELALTDEYKRGVLIDSIVDASASITSALNRLTFCVQMTLGEYFDLFDAIKQENKLNSRTLPENRFGKGEIVLSPSTKTLLYDSWNGGGSLGFIDLATDVRLPINLIASATPDGTYGCSIMGIYGVNEEFYTPSLKQIVPMERDAIDKAVQQMRGKDKAQPLESVIVDAKNTAGLDERTINGNEQIR